MSNELQEKASISNQDEDIRQENENEQQVLKRLATLGDLLKDMLPERNVSEGMYQGSHWGDDRGFSRRLKLLLILIPLLIFS